MRRTQIYLPADVHNHLRQEADKKNTTISELIRQRITGATISHYKWQTAGEIMDELNKIGKTVDWNKAPTNVSELVDETLYGKDD